MMPVRVLELRSVRGTGGGPEKTILQGAARTDPHQFAVSVCYLRDARDGAFGVDATAGDLPIDYVEIVERHSLDPSIWPRLRRLVRDRRIDIVHAHDYKTNFLAWMLAKREPVTALSTVHGWTGHSWRERWIYYPGDRRILCRLPKLIAVSTDIRNELVAHGAQPDRVVTILNGIDHQIFRRERSRERWIRRQLGLEDSDLVIGTVGRLEPQKRIDRLIDAFAELRTAHPTLKLVIVGDGSLQHALASQIERLGLGAACCLLGHRTDIVELHHAFDLFVQASDYEGTPNAVLEAMALETPIVATDVGGTAELVRHGVEGVIVPSGNQPALVQAMRAVLADARAAAARAVAARRRVETELSFDARMAAVETVYTDLVRDRRGPNAAAAVAVRT